eukprot:CCRYP_007209-RH/>CCRYP_007209-RH protein AED:0.45 eAED:0.45 QI:0/-1/0/1/-1/0/1/0/113
MRRLWECSSTSVDIVARTSPLPSTNVPAIPFDPLGSTSSPSSESVVTSKVPWTRVLSSLLLTRPVLTAFLMLTSPVSMATRTPKIHIVPEAEPVLLFLPLGVRCFGNPAFKPK